MCCRKTNHVRQRESVDHTTVREHPEKNYTVFCLKCEAGKSKNEIDDPVKFKIIVSNNKSLTITIGPSDIREDECLEDCIIRLSKKSHRRDNSDENKDITVEK